jgi:hypothetical protein
VGIDTWNGASGLWNNGTLWSNGTAPGGDDTAILGGTAHYTIITQGLETIGSLVVSDPGAILEISGGKIDTAGVFTNEGTISSYRTSSTSMPTISEIAGIIEGNGGFLEVGSFTDLQIDSAVSSGQTVSFTSSNGTLTLEQPGSFGAKIVGMTAGDVIDAVGATSGTVSGDTVTLFSGSIELGTLAFSNSANLNVATGTGAVTITAGSVDDGSRPRTLSNPLGANTNNLAVGNNNTLTTNTSTQNLITLGSGDVVFSGGADTFVGGTGADTIQATGSVLVFTSAPLTFSGLGGQATLILGSDGQVSGGLGAVTVFGGNGTLNASGGALGGNVLVAGSGNATLTGNAFGGKSDIFVGGSAGSTDQYTSYGTLSAIFAGAATGNIVDYSSAQYVIGGAGADTINQYIGAEGIILGSGHMVLNQYSQSGTNVLALFDGTAGGSLTVNGASAGSDIVYLGNYGANEIANAVSTAFHGTTSTVFTFSDGSSITFAGLNNLGSSIFYQ